MDLMHKNRCIPMHTQHQGDATVLTVCFQLPVRHLGEEVEAEEVIFGSRIISLFPELQGKGGKVADYIQLLELLW